MQDEDQAVVQAIRQGNLDEAPLADNERALLQYVKLITQHAYKASPESTQLLKDAGWTDEQIAEAIYVTAIFAFFNRIADAFGLEDPGYDKITADGKPAPAPAHRYQ